MNKCVCQYVKQYAIHTHRHAKRGEGGRERKRTEHRPVLISWIFFAVQCELYPIDLIHSKILLRFLHVKKNQYFALCDKKEMLFEQLLTISKLEMFSFPLLFQSFCDLQ